MKKHLHLICILLIICSQLTFAQDTEKDYSDAFKFIEVWLDAQKDYENLPGITAAVVEDQKTLWTAAFGYANREEKVKAQSSTLFSICSISKLFTAVAIMKLYDEGRLRLDDPIQQFLPEFDLEQQYPGSGPITIRGLLTHSSGLPRENTYTHWNGPDFHPITNKQLMEGLHNLKTLYPAATYFQYSNLALTLLGQIIEAITQEPYEEYVTENILEPLGLSDTQPYMPKDLFGTQLAVGYSSPNRDGTLDPLHFFEAGAVNSAAGFSSNVADLAKFASWQFRLLDTNTTEILKSSTLKNMQNVHWVDPDWKTTWGLGFAVWKGNDGTKWVSHGGHCPGYKTTLRMQPKTKMGYSVMINSSGADPNKYAEGIITILNKVESPSEKEKPKPDFTEYTGYYKFYGMEEVYVGVWGDKLALLYLPSNKPGNAMDIFKHVEGDTFQRVRDNGEPGELLRFLRDDNQKITQFRVENYLFDRLNR